MVGKIQTVGMSWGMDGVERGVAEAHQVFAYRLGPG